MHFSINIDVINLHKRFSTVKINSPFQLTDFLLLFKRAKQHLAAKSCDKNRIMTFHFHALGTTASAMN